MAYQPRHVRIPGIAQCLLAVCLGVAVLGLAGCETQVARPTAGTADGQPSQSLPREEAVENAVRYEVLPGRSDIRFLVFRAGPLARLGHNHVIQAKNVRGEILLAPEIHRSRFFIEIPVRDFQVDDPSARMDEGGDFQQPPEDAAIAGTTRNMLGEQVLDAANYPLIDIRSAKMSGPAWGPEVTVRIRLRGIERELVVPTAVEYARDRLVVTATFPVKQSDFGIVPMRVLGGALQVDDAVKVRMRLVAGKRERPTMPSPTTD